MPFKKGQSGNINGRPKGRENVTTTKVREAIAKFADGNVDRLTEWLEKIAVDDPKGAADLYLKVIEYHIPKLARTELAQDKDSPFNITINYPKEGE